MQNIINFIKYHNLVPVILGVVLIATASAFASEEVRNTVIGEEIVTEQGIDNSQILAADLDNFDMTLQITNVSEDDEKYYIDYTFRTIAIVDNSWQEVWEEKRLAVSKENLGDGDLTLYVTKELSQVVDNELAYLKEVQEIEKEKGLQKIVASVEYTGLRGLLSDLQEKISSEPVCQSIDEVCDAVDNDCDGLIDEDLGQTVCGVGACQAAVSACLNGALIACVPGTPTEEICGDGIDNNCDGIVDNPEICQPQPPAEEEPVCQPTTEICDGIDNDCDGLVDEDNVCQAECQAQTFYYDGDGDGFGNYGNFISVCETPAGYVSDNTDCDDGDASINPAVTEICDDGIDNDCDGEVDVEDEDCQAVPPTPVCDSEHLDLCETEADCLAAEGYWYNDQCNAEAEIPPQEVCDPTHLNLCTTQAECETVAGFWYNEGCNAEPEAPACTPSEEICDGIDNDCDDLIDEDLGQTSCGMGACEVTIENCLADVLQTCTPGMPSDEICDGIDNDCDGQIDEGGVCETPEEPEE